jgi:hypothetical protein
MRLTNESSRFNVWQNRVEAAVVDANASSTTLIVQINWDLDDVSAQALLGKEQRFPWGFEYWLEKSDNFFCLDLLFYRLARIGPGFY